MFNCISLRHAESRRQSMFQLEPMEKRVLLTGNISGTVFNDYNANGIQDGNEPGLAGWTVYLDSNNNNLPDLVEQQRVTNSLGRYEFLNLATPSTYIVREVLQGGYVQTVPGTGGVILDGRQAPAPQPEPAPDTHRRYTTTEIVVAFEGNQGLPALQRAVASNASLRKLVDVSRSRNMFTVSGATLVEVKLPARVDPRNVVARFESIPGVRWAQVNYIYDDIDPRDLTPNDPQYPSQYHHPLMRNNLAWDTTQGDPRVTIAITDDGIDTEHQDLFVNIFIKQSEIPPTRLANLTDLNGDGYISMVELQDPVNRGPFKAVDVNSDNRITATDLLALMIKDGNGNDTGNGGWSDLIDQDGNGFADDLVGRDVWSNDNDSRPASSSFAHGTHVMGIAAARTNNGVGVAGTAGNITVMPIRFYSGTGWNSTHVSNAYRYATDNGAKIISTSYNVDSFTTNNDQIFAAAVQYMYDAGVLHFNSGGNNNPLQNPPRQKWDQSIFVTSTDQNDLKSSFSKYGWGMDVAAPGSSILSTLLNNTYGLNSGTSMATPNAAGVAALIWSHNPTWSREKVIAQLLGSADDIDGLNPSFAGQLGTGRVNSHRALTQTIAPPRVRQLLNFPAENSFTLSQPTSFNLDIRNVFDPATVNLSSFELRGDGFDGMFGTSDDVLIPMTLTFGSGLFSNYMIGNNRMNFTVLGVMQPDRYRFSAKTTLTDPFGQPIDGNGDGIGGDAFTRTFTLLGATNQYTVNLLAGQNVTTANFGNHDIAPPRPLSSQFAFATAQQIIVQFNEDVSASLDVNDLILENLTAGGTVDTTGFTLSYNSGTNTATWHVNGILPSADFRARFPAAGIADLSGNILDGNGNGVGGDEHSFLFFFMQGDANRDRRVNLLDFDILATHFGQSGTDFTRADFNYDGVTNLLDFDILASRFGSGLASSPSEGTMASKFGSDKRIADDVLGSEDQPLIA